MKNVNQVDIIKLLNSMDTSNSESTPTLRRQSRSTTLPFIPCVGMPRPVFEDSEGIESYFNCEVLCDTISELSYENSNSDIK